MRIDNHFLHSDNEDFHQSLLHLMEEHRIPGVSLALIKNETITTFELWCEK